MFKFEVDGQEQFVESRFLKFKGFKFLKLKRVKLRFLWHYTVSCYRYSGMHFRQTHEPSWQSIADGLSVLWLCILIDAHILYAMLWPI